ncbi:FtsX-like permease family protein [Halapricum sp. CBA1109]|uniref:ABC transporter permease n=1 Tax=Halapricum sp. CBA1109 TaxID=2668068 RepID=UPI0012F90B27|nr:ABC transporter permease [Halapricum sp. CBA1109]MUV90836.1 FtsX-like permease family protein [Halapricum sp. CBA1109]
MNVIESFRIAWRSIKGHKLRSTLTTLGVIIGIAAVITFVTLGTGVQEGVLGDVSPDDRSNVYIWAAPADNANQGPLSGAQPVFTQRDAEELDERSAIEAAYVFNPVPAQSIGYRGQTVPRQDGISATGREYLDPEDMGEGRRFRMGEREAVINPAMAGLFEEEITTNSTINITAVGGIRLNATVVGITNDSSSKSPFGGFGPSPRIYLPSDPYYEQFNRGGGDLVRYIAVIAEAESADTDDVQAAKADAEAYLNSSDSDANSRTENASLRYFKKTSTELLSQLEDVFNLLQNFIVGIAGISLLVGSIGIANIMLVSVTERTREIGIMKAVGAQRRDILGLFLVEAIILGVIGAVFGTLLGLGAGFALAEFVGVPYVFPTTWAAVAVVVGILVGVLAGLYPAWSASRTDPIDALRYE